LDENYVQISEDVLKLSLSHSLLNLIDSKTSATDKIAIKSMMNEILNALSPNSDNSYELAYYNFISKFSDNHNVEAKTAEKLLEKERTGKLDGAKDLIGLNVDGFQYLAQEAQFQTLFQFLVNMNMDIQETYKELDMLEADAFNKPIFQS
jgi:hypothetical protein